TAYWKPVQTGSPDSDEATVRWLCPPQLVTYPTPFVYPLPASPDQAALAAALPPPSVADLCRHTADLPGAKLTLIEGAGGLLVPLNERNETWLDYLTEADLPVVVVAKTTLGTLNHTGLTIEALRQRAVTILAVILQGKPHPANFETLRRMYPDIPF